MTITGTTHYYGMKPFEINRILLLVKEPDNEYDAEAIRAELPYIGKVGYVANSPSTMAKGTMSAGRLYDRIGNYAYAQFYL
ncbi:MAG: HIRAN domain-containing protein [Desulfitobacteriia bacterium]